MKKDAASPLLPDSTQSDKLKMVQIEIKDETQDTARLERQIYTENQEGAGAAHFTLR